MSNRARALTVLIALFLFGGAVGAGSVYMWARKALRERSPRAEQSGHRPLMLSVRLKMTPDQEKRFREILAESRKQLDEVRAESAPRVFAIRAEMNRKIAAILNDEQKKEFEAIQKEMESSRGGRGGRGRRPEWGPPRSPVPPPK